MIIMGKENKNVTLTWLTVYLLLLRLCIMCESVYVFHVDNNIDYDI